MPVLERIAYVLRVFPKFSETFIASELAELRRRRVEVRILSLQVPAVGVRHAIIAEAGLDRLTCYDPGEFKQLLKEFRPQLLHAHFATEATAAAIDLAGEMDLPFTFTVHGYDIHRKAPPDLKARAAAARAVITVSQANADCLVKQFGIPRSDIRVISCGVDTQFFRPVEPPVRSACHPPVLVCVARHVQVKNLGMLLESCARLRDRGLKFRCILIGDGPCRAELESVRTALQLQELVQLLGVAEQSEVRRWWQTATIGVLTSDNEGMPVSLMEAGACGLPVAATAVGGVPELVQDGVTGLLVPPGAPEELAGALERLLLDEPLRIRLGDAARRRVVETFSVVHQVDELLGLWSEILAVPGGARIFVSDPFNAADDPALPTLRLALQSDEAKRQLKHHLPRLVREHAKLRVKAIRIVKHKPSKRCVVEYELRLQSPGLPAQTETLIGKVRAKRFGKEGYRLQERFWQAGFNSQSADGISVPEPIGVIPLFQMWLQRKVKGTTATSLLPRPGGLELACKVADAIHKVHRAAVPTERHHGMAEELAILHGCLAKVAENRPELSPRLKRIGSACNQLAGTVPEPKVCGIHRDFYPAQVVVASETPQEVDSRPPARLFLIDFDLYCVGDPALDVGNFIGHMTEQALREFGDAGAMARQEQALEDRFVALSGEAARPAVKTYTTLTLVRHIYLSAQAGERQQYAEPLLELCERRLGLGRPTGAIAAGV